MDTWETLTHRIQQAILAEEPEAATSAGFELVCQFGRTLELISTDLDRIATAIEKHAAPTVEGAPAEPDPGQGKFDL